MLKEFDCFIKTEKELALIELITVKGSSPREVGAWMLVSPQKCLNTIGGGVLEFSMVAEAKKMMKDRSVDKLSFKSTLNPKFDQCCGGVVSCQISTVTKNTMKMIEKRIKNEISNYKSLYLFGAGHVGKSVIKLGINLPLKITVTDTRLDLVKGLQNQFRDYADTIKFNVDAIPERIIKSSPENSAYLVMTHSHATDFTLIEEILSLKKIGYVGMIGSKSKKLSLQKYLKRKNISDNKADLVRCPIGRPIKFSGRKSPEVIAALTISDILESLDNE